MILVSEIANLIEGEIDGNPHLKIYGVCNIKNGEEGKISFLGNSKYNDFLSTTNSSAIIVKTNHKFKNTEKTLIRVKNPTLGFAKVLEIFDKNKSFKNEINPTAIFDKTVILGKNISLGANVVIGKNCIIGKNSSIKANVTIYDDTVIGESVTIDSGTVIGADGFGWIPDKNGHYKIPQIGNVIIEDNVWIGANCTVDRGTFNPTIIRKSCKLDNQVHIAHNVEIGQNSLISGQTGIAGSTIIGKNVIIAGQCGIADNLHIGDNCVIGAKSAVLKSIPKNAFVSGNPARNHKNRLKQELIIQQLPSILRRIRNLENNK